MAPTPTKKERYEYLRKLIEDVEKHLDSIQAVSPEETDIISPLRTSTVRLKTAVKAREDLV